MAEAYLPPNLIEFDARKVSGEEENPVSKPSPSVEAMRRRSRITADLMDGITSLRNDHYLPKEKKETKEEHSDRICRTPYLPFYSTLVNDVVEKPFSRDVSFDAETPEKIKEFSDDVDREGTGIEDFAKSWFRDAINNGISHMLVDYPPKPGDSEVTVEMQELLDLRPYWINIPQRNVLGWQTTNIGGKRVLTQFRYYEETEEAVGPYTTAMMERVKVWNLAPSPESTLPILQIESWIKIEVDGNKKWVMEGAPRIVLDSDSNVLNHIPIVSLYSRKVDFMMGYPLYEAVAYENVYHFQSSSDQSNILHIGRIPILLGTGLSSGLEEDGESVLDTLGARRAIDAPEGAKLVYVEPTGTAMAAGRIDIVDSEARMKGIAKVGILGQQPGNATATAKAIDKAETDSTIKSQAKALQNALNMALKETALFMDGVDENTVGSVDLNTDFGVETDQAVLNALKELFNGGVIDQPTYRSEMQRRGVLSDDVDIEENVSNSATDNNPTPNNQENNPDGNVITNT